MEIYVPTRMGHLLKSVNSTMPSSRPARSDLLQLSFSRESNVSESKWALNSASAAGSSVAKNTRVLGASNRAPAPDDVIYIVLFNFHVHFELLVLPPFLS